MIKEAISISIISFIWFFIMIALSAIGKNNKKPELIMAVFIGFIAGITTGLTIVICDFIKYLIC